MSLYRADGKEFSHIREVAALKITATIFSCRNVKLNFRYILICFFVFRYAVQLLTPASRIAQLAGRDEIEPSDIEEVCCLFLNAKQSAKILAEHESQFMK